MLAGLTRIFVFWRVGGGRVGSRRTKKKRAARRGPPSTSCFEDLKWGDLRFRLPERARRSPVLGVCPRPADEVVAADIAMDGVIQRRRARKDQWRAFLRDAGHEGAQ